MDIQEKPVTPEDNNQNTEEIKDETVNEQEESTIFSSNKKNIVKKSKMSSKKKAIITVVSMFVAALIIGVAIFCVVKFVKDDESQSSTSYTIRVKSQEEDSVSKIEIKNEYGEFTLLPKTVKDETSTDGSTTINWYIENMDSPLIAQSMVGTVAGSCLSINATREMTDKTLEYGFDKPFATVKVYTKEQGKDYTVTIGNMAPDETGYYMQLSGDEKIYLATVGTVEDINFYPEKLAKSNIVETPVLDDNTAKEDKKYFDDDGAISTFDYIELSGTKYNGEKIIIKPLKDNEMAKYTVQTGEGVRYADEEVCTNMFGIVTNGLVAIETYKFNPTAEDIVKYKLQNPEYTVSIKYGSTTINIKASMYDTEKKYYATMVEGNDAIYAMHSDALDMLYVEEEDFYNEFVWLEYYDSYSKVTVTTPKGSYVFNTAVNGTGEDEEFVVTYNNKKLDGDLFKAYYQYIVTIAPKVEENYVKAAPDYTVDFVFKDDSKGTGKITLTKQSDRRYLVTVNGMDMGIVSSTVYDNLTEYVENVINGKEIPEP